MELPEVLVVFGEKLPKNERWGFFGEQRYDAEWCEAKLIHSNGCYLVTVSVALGDKNALTHTGAHPELPRAIADAERRIKANLAALWRIHEWAEGEER